MKWLRLYIEEILRNNEVEVTVPTRPGGYTTTFRKLHLESNVKKKYILYVNRQWREHKEYVWKQQLLTYQGLYQRYGSKDIARMISNMVGWQREYQGPFFCEHCYYECNERKEAQLFDNPVAIYCGWIFLFFLHTVIYFGHEFKTAIFTFFISFLLTFEWKTILLGLLATYGLGMVTPEGYDWFSFWVILIIYLWGILKRTDPVTKRILNIIKKCQH